MLNQSDERVNFNQLCELFSDGRPFLIRVCWTCKVLAVRQAALTAQECVCAEKVSITVTQHCLDRHAA